MRRFIDDLTFQNEGREFQKKFKKVYDREPLLKHDSLSKIKRSSLDFFFEIENNQFSFKLYNIK